MNAIILSAILGVVLMFTGIFTTNKSTIRAVAVGGILLLLLANIAELRG